MTGRTTHRTAIRTPDQRLRVFVSSTLQELADERAAVSRAVSALRLTPVMFELGARPHPPQELYRAYLAQSDVFIGLYWQRYGWIGPDMDVSGLEDEFELSRRLPRLLYVKTPAPDREARLTDLLDRIKRQAAESYRTFRTARELGRLVRDDLAVMLSEWFAAPGSAAPKTPKGGRSAGPPLPVGTTSPIGREQTILGRESETRILAAVLDTVPSSSASVVVHGEAGQGKSSLLRWAAELAARRGFTVLQTAGVEFERELAFGGLIAVLRPVLDRVGSLSGAQRDALEAAMGLSAGDAPPLVTSGATLTLLSLAADENPVFVVVDDAQWVDQASLASLLFAARRTGVDRVGFVFAQRAGVPCLLDQTGFDRIELGGLDRDVGMALLTAQGVATPVAERCWERTGGNPLALIEGSRGLTARQRSGDDPLPPVLPAASRLLATFQARLDRLPDATIKALGLAVLETRDDLTIVAPALSAAGSSVADLVPAERDHLVAVTGGQLAWHHPLVRSAVYQRVDGRWCRQSHRALADAAHAAGHDDIALWHLSEAVVGPDDDIAGRMSALGVAARRRGAMAAAAEAHQQAARLSTSDDDGDRQILAAADARWASGDLLAAADLLVDRIASASAIDTAAQMAIVLGQAEMWTAGAPAGIERFERHVAAVSDTRPDMAAYLLVHAATARLLALDGGAAVGTAERAVTFAERTDDTAALFAASAMHTLTHIFDGAGASASERLEPMTQLILAALETGTEGADDLAQLCAFGLLACERWREATDLLNRVIRSSETSGMMARSAFARVLLAEVLWRTGRWAESLAALSHSISLQEAVKPGQVVPGTLALMARLEAGFGHTDSCRAHVAQVLDAPPDIEMFTVIALSAIGLLELGSGRNAEAATAFDQILDRTGRVGEPGWLWWQGDAIEAYAACGRGDDARRVLDSLNAQATATGRPWAQAAVARGHGLLTPGQTCQGHLSAALDGFSSVGSPFEEARTLLIRGQRRIGLGAHQIGARDIAAARTIFDRLGARAWSERASAIRGEISGADDSLTSRLTPAEIRVAIPVGHGASNREAADQLFISAKTVDYHLQSIYRKLGLRNRAQLMALVLSDTRH